MPMDPLAAGSIHRDQRSLISNGLLDASYASPSHPAAAGSTSTTAAHQKKRSKGSTSTISTLDKAFRHATEPRHGGGSRQTSVDYSPSNGSSSSKARMAASANSVLNRSRPVPPDYHDFEPLPQATIRNVTESPSVSPQPAYASPNASKSLPQKPRTSHGPASPTAGHFFQAPPIPNERSHVPRHAASMGNLDPSKRSQPQAPPPVPAKEKTGFFKRVFGGGGGGGGGGGRSSNAQQESRSGPPQLPALTTVINAEARPGASADSALGMASPSSTFNMAPPPIPGETQGKEMPPQTLRNKTSFFRRRRKTGPQEKELSSTPASTPTASSFRPAAEERPEKMPSTGSLQKVMNPFLNEAATFSHEHLADEASFKPMGENIYSFASDARGRDAVPASRSQRAGSASRAEASSPIPIARPHDTLRPSTSIRRDGPSPSPSSNSDIRASFIGSYDSASGRHAMKLVRNRPSDAETTQLHNMLLGISPRATNSREDLRTPSPRAKSPMPDSAKGATAPSPAQEAKAPARVPSSPILPPSAARARPTAMQRAASDGTSSVRLEPKETASTTPTTAMPARTRSPESVMHSPTVDSEYQSATSLPLLHVDADDAAGAPDASPAGEDADPLQPTAADHERAQQMLDQQGEFSNPAKAMDVLHQADAAGERARRAYLAQYDFASLSILQALRDLCNRIALKGETQQVDRILSTFARRWCDCNPRHGFKAVDVVHTLTYSILLLNTDLHMADVDSKMSRSQFIKNTLPTLRNVAEESGEDTIRAPSAASPSRPGIPWRDARSPTPVEGNSISAARTSMEQTRPAGGRLSVISPPPGRPTSEVPSFASPSPYGNRSADTSSALIGAPFEGSTKGWENQLEAVLKDIYQSIRDERLPLHGASDRHLQTKDSSGALSVGSALRRTGSVLSKTTSDGPRGRPEGHSMGASSRFASRNRTKNRLHPASTFGSSRTASRTSLEENMWSPSGSSTWSKSMYQTQTTMSTDSIGSRFTFADERYQQSIGFANALSHAIIREEGQGDEEEDSPQAFEIDELLELAGAPFAKEGLVKHKHHLETTDKKARDRNWSEVFVVIEKGWMRLFSFNTKSVRAAQKKSGGKTVVGGGNWMESAETLGAFMLRQTIANALPPPGYSKQRPHVFALSLPTGAVHLFHVGTTEIAKEFVSTANYWSARLSKEPLVGGVSNIEYGWGDQVINSALLPETASVASPSSPRSATPTSGIRAAMVASPTSTASHSRGGSVSMSINHSSRPSLSGSIRGSVEAAAARARTPADRLQLADWAPPQQSLVASTLPEAAQLSSLQAYVLSIDQELAQHNELRAPMQLAFSPRHPNAVKAMANWEKKSSYLLHEIVKFQTYIDSLNHAKAARERMEEERAEYEKEKRERMAKGHEAKASQSTNGSFEFPEETKEAIRQAQMQDP